MLADQLMHRLHQSSVSRTIRKVPGVSVVANTWWLRNQGRAFRTAFSTLAGPLSSSESVSGAVDVPAPRDVETRDAETVARGDTFTEEMGQWCATTKFSTLGYQDVYGRVLAHLRSAEPRVLEVGIGVNDPGAASGMESSHQPGASLVGWSHYFAGAEIHGADIDRRVLVDTALYTTHFTDQRDPAALDALAREIGPGLDLIVDDGLHTAEANALTCARLLPLLSPRGVMVVEDILPEYDTLWANLARTLNSAYRVTFFPGHIMRSERGEGLAVFTRVR